MKKQNSKFFEILKITIQPCRFNEMQENFTRVKPISRIGVVEIVRILALEI